jgi:hypothetical protein
LLFYKYSIFKNIIYLIGFINNFLFFAIKNKKNINNYIYKFLPIFLYLKYFFYFLKSLIFLLNNYLYLKYLYFFLLNILIYKRKKGNTLYFINYKLIFLINIKIKKYIFEFNINKFFNINLFLFFKNIKNNFSLQYFINFKKLKKNVYYSYLKDMVFLFYISSLYGIRNLFNNFILWNLNIKEKTHYFFLNNIFNVVIELFKKSFFFTKGFICTIKGKINGNTRKRRFNISLSSFGLQSLNSIIIYSSNYRVTRFGALSIKS